MTGLHHLYVRLEVSEHLSVRCTLGNDGGSLDLELDGVGDQVGGEGPDVIGDVDVFGEAVDRAICLRQLGSALEREVPAEGRLEQGVEGCDDPDVLLEQERAVRAVGFGNPQGVAPVGGGERPVRRLSHERGAALIDFRHPDGHDRPRGGEFVDLSTGEPGQDRLETLLDLMRGRAMPGRG